MASTFRLSSRWQYASGILIAVSAVLGVVYVHAWRTGSGIPAAQDKRRLMPRQQEIGNRVAATAWSVFVSAQRTEENKASRTSAERFRLAGTFAIESDNGDRLQKAILDDTVRNEQQIVGVGDVVDDATIENIRYDRVTIRTATGTRDLVLEFAGIPEVATAGSSNTLSDATASTSNRFGCVKVQDGRWQFSRQPMMDYYQELLDEPDRMVAVFDTMKPVRDDRNRITGYVVGVEGEKAFFDAVGLREGDIVRNVNSVAMTNRRRAEFFIDEFLKNRMNAIVLDVERDGAIQKQVYQVKE